MENAATVRRIQAIIRANGDPADTLYGVLNDEDTAALLAAIAAINPFPPAPSSGYRAPHDYRRNRTTGLEVTMTNEVPVYTTVAGQRIEWRLSEFATREGWVMIHPELLQRLSQLRVNLAAQFPDTKVHIVSCVRSIATRHLLAEAKGGYVDQGGEASRFSWHAPEWGGIAADITATSRDGVIPLTTLHAEASAIFPYAFIRPDHVHVDVREVHVDLTGD